MASPVPAIAADRVSKTFRIPRESVHTLKERALHPFRRPGHDELQALRDVSFSVPKGEFFGIVGRNGSGKSTLLKCLAGIYRPDEGGVYVNGRLSTFIELGVGFNPDLAARDNVLINAAMLGLSQREARRRFDSIIDFAELSDFVDLKLKNYSSGMMVRLAFAVMIQVDAEILLVDEVLAVGDAAFQQKCFDEFGRIRRSGTTVLLVTHDVGAVRRFCDRALVMHHGAIQGIGDPEEISEHYLRLNFADDQQLDAAPGDEEAEHRLGDRQAEIVEGWFEDAEGHRIETLEIGAPCAFVAVVRFNAELHDPVFGIELTNANDDLVWGADTSHDSPTGRFGAGDETVVRFAFDNHLAPDRYHATPTVGRSQGGLRWHDRRSRMADVMIHGTRQSSGLLELSHETSVQRRSPATPTSVEVR